MFYYMFHFCEYVFVHTTLRERSEGNLRELLLSIPCGNQVIRFGKKYSYLSSQLTGPKVLFKFTTVSY